MLAAGLRGEGGFGTATTVGLATWSGLPDLHPDDRLLLDELRRRGVRAEPAVWSDPSVEWDRFDGVILRSTWDYHREYERFLDWVERVGRWTRLWNPAATVRWNSHKSYLLDLAKRGLPVIPTELPRPGETLAETSRRRGWGPVVVKAAVSANAENCVLVAPDEKARFESRYQEMSARVDLLVQPFVPGVLDPGERSLVFFNGRFSHAFRKGPALPRDLRDAAGLLPLRPSERERAVAVRTIAALDDTPLYARVDLVDGGGGTPWLMEVELIEPLLDLAADPKAPGRFVDAWSERQRVG